MTLLSHTSTTFFPTYEHAQAIVMELTEDMPDWHYYIVSARNETFVIHAHDEDDQFVGTI